MTIHVLFPRHPAETQEQYDKREAAHWRKVEASESSLLALRGKHAERMKVENNHSAHLA